MWSKAWGLALLPVATVLGLLSTSAYVEAEPQMERSTDRVVGASISHPEEWVLKREAYTFDETYGFALWRQGDAPAEEGGIPAVRVALA